MVEQARVRVFPEYAALVVPINVSKGAINIPLQVNYKVQLTLQRKVPWKDFLEVGIRTS